MWKSHKKTVLFLQSVLRDCALLRLWRGLWLYGLDAEKLSFAKPDSIVMHPGPMNRGIEIDSAIADHPTRSVIGEQVEMGVALRMAVLDVLARGLRRNG